MGKEGAGLGGDGRGDSDLRQSSWIPLLPLPRSTVCFIRY